MYTCYKYFCKHVILLKTMYLMSSHQNLSVRLSSILSFSKLLLSTYRVCQNRLGKTKIHFIISARCTNRITMDRFPKLAKFPGLWRIFSFILPHKVYSFFVVFVIILNASLLKYLTSVLANHLLETPCLFT